MQFVVSGCADDPSTPAVARCSAELSIPIHFYDINVLPESGGKKLSPGIGFGIRAAGNTGAAPEFLTSYGTVGQLLGDRASLPTLLFGPPPKQAQFPLKVMSWNLRLFESDGLRNPFQDINMQQYASIMATQDIVAIQEGWYRPYVQDVLDEVNKIRAAKSTGQHPLPPMHLLGPVDFSPSLSKAIEQSVGTFALCTAATFQKNQDAECETSGTHGGLWIMTHLPLMKSDRMVFEENCPDGKACCKGEDCFRAKGVQYVRLGLTHVSLAKEQCHGEFGGGDEQPAACKPLDSGDQFIDIFNAHLQSSNPTLCSSDAYKSTVIAAIVAAAVDPGAAAGLLTLKALSDVNLNCNASDAKVRENQLQLMNAFVAAEAAKDRPALILGDFNLDGKPHGADWSTVPSEYQNVVKELQLGQGATPTDDVGVPWPDDWAWDIDHSDLAQEFVYNNFTVPWNSSYPPAIGTFIGHDPLGTKRIDADYAGHWDGHERFDFALLRPPVPPKSSSFEKTRWVAMKDPGAKYVWTSPWPGLPDDFGPPPQSYSDHKPLALDFVFTSLAVPGRYHPSWKHDITQRVVTADATGEGDCWGCGKVDPYTKMHWQVAHASGGTSKGDFTGSECSNDDHVSWPNDSCTDNWKHSGTHDGSTHEPIYNLLHAELWDDDTTSSDDSLHPDTYGQAMVWDASLVQLLKLATGAPKYEFPVNDNLPIDQCDYTTPSYLCFENRISELAPGEQF